MDITKQMFPMEDWDCPEAFAFAGVKGYEPMLAKELDTEEAQDEALNDPNYIIEEKFDGTRALVHFFNSNDGARNKFEEFEPCIIEPKYQQIALVLIEITKEFSSEIKDMYCRAKNEDILPSFRMNYLRSVLDGKTFEYEDEWTNIIAKCGSQFIETTYTVGDNVLSGKISYRESLGVIDTLIDYDCYGVESGYCRVFSRRISKKTGFYAENTDSLPQIRDLNFPNLAGTILDGEMFIDGLPFKEVSSTLNCLWDEAVRRQKEKGYISFHAFDILFYKGIDLRRMKLARRKMFLKRVIDDINSPYMQFVEYQRCGEDVSISAYVDVHGAPEEVHEYLVNTGKDGSYPHFMEEYEKVMTTSKLSPRAFYEYIIATGGEGVIVKPIDGQYRHKRGWEYSKIKAFLTREMVLIRFAEPTKEYTGKAPKDWEYWEDGIPVTKYYARGQVGNMVLGVFISSEELNKIPKNKRGNVIESGAVTGESGYYIMEVCECGGMTDEEREMYTADPQKYIGKVFEIKANGIMTDSGRLRHPRILRQRNDKNPDQCTWKDHIGG